MLGSSNKFRNGLLGTAAVALIGATALMTAPKDANATAFAYSAFEITNLEMTGLTDGFNTFRFIKNGMTVNLNGTTVSTPGSAPNTNAGASVDDAQICVGSCGGFVENQYVGVGQPTGPVPGPATQGSFAVADMNMLNTVIDATNPSAGGAFGTQSGAQSGDDGFGTSSVSANQQMGWTFELSTAGPVEFTWDQEVHMEVASTNPGETATAALSFSIAITDNTNTTIFEDTIFGSSNTLTISAINNPGKQTNTFAASDSSGPVNLLANTPYELVFLFDSSANVTSIDVSEPGTLGLLGLGLLGLGVAGYRRRKRA